MSESVMGQDHFQNRLQRDLIWNPSEIMSSFSQNIREDFQSWRMNNLKENSLPNNSYVFCYGGKAEIHLLFFNLEGAQHSFNDATLLLFKPKLVTILRAHVYKINATLNLSGPDRWNYMINV